MAMLKPSQSYSGGFIIDPYTGNIAQEMQFLSGEDRKKKTNPILRLGFPWQPSNNIRASNRISTTEVVSRPKNVKGHPSRNYHKSDRRSKLFFIERSSVELEATPKALLPNAGPGQEAAMISADTLDDLMVNNLFLFETRMKHFAKKEQSFKGDQLVRFLDKWKETTDSEVLNCVKGQYIEFSPQSAKNLGYRT